LKCCKLQNKTVRFQYEELKAKLEICKLFSSISNDPNSTFIIPSCFNCSELLRKEDLEVLAEKLSTFEIADAIVKSYAKSLVKMQSNTKVNYEEEIYKKHEEMVIENRKRESRMKHEEI